jgi:hypothetical protein
VSAFDNFMKGRTRRKKFSLPKPDADFIVRALRAYAFSLRSEGVAATKANRPKATTRMLENAERAEALAVAIERAPLKDVPSESTS